MIPLLVCFFPLDTITTSDLTTLNKLATRVSINGSLYLSLKLKF